MPDLILASASPRRRELLSLTGLTFTIDAAEVDEHTSLGAKEAVQELCRRKALAVASRHPGEIVLAADTLVAMHDIPFGKPEDEEDACHMLRSLSGKWHQVYTGVCAVSRDGQVFTGLDTSDVHFMEMSDTDILAYVKTGEPMDKAGAYAIQGPFRQFIKSIDGDYYNVVGLPLYYVSHMLKKIRDRDK